MKRNFSRWLSLAVLLAGLLPGPALGAGLIEAQSVVVASAINKFPGTRQRAAGLISRPLWSAPQRDWQLRLAASVGSLQRRDTADVSAGLGPLLSYRSQLAGWPALWELGSSVNWIDGDGLARRELGKRLEFASHLAAGLALNRQGSAALLMRVQHISNAGLSSRNPGLDLAGLELRIRYGG